MLKGKLIAVDLDETISHGKFWEHEPVPNIEMIKKIWKWYIQGAHIIIYSARQPKYYTRTLAWLIKYEVPFHGIALFIKPSADYYVDSKQINDINN